MSKLKGVCGVCQGVFRLTGDGKLYGHGGRAKNKKCPGSDSTPGFASTQPTPDPFPVLGSSTSQFSSSSPSSASNNLGLNSAYDDGLDAKPSSILLEARLKSAPRLMDHIPKGARPACSALLKSLIVNVLSEPASSLHWCNLLAFAPAVLCQPPRGGRGGNTTKLIKQRVSEFAGPASIHSRIENPPRNSSGSDAHLAAVVSSKLEQGNFKAAVRLICSEDSPAALSSSTINLLKEKHPAAPANRRPPPNPLDYSLTVDHACILQAIKSFPSGSSGGLDGLRPQHLRDLTSCQVECDALIPAICDFVNLLLAGVCPVDVQPILFGGNLIALAKKCGGVRPIVVGSTWRRLVAKCACTFASKQLSTYLAPYQLGVGVKGGAEAAAHAARRFISSTPSDSLLLKLDFSNAFNTLRRDSILEVVHRLSPEIYNFVHLAYHQKSILSFRGVTIESDEGCQQGDPLGPLLFAVTIHPILLSLKSDFKMGYLDDLSVGGDANTLSEDFHLIQGLVSDLGLSLNTNKCEIISGNGFSNLPALYSTFLKIRPEDCEMLGAALSKGEVLDRVLSSKVASLSRAADRLKLLHAHDALLILKNSLSAPKLTYLLRTSPCTGNLLLSDFDSILRSSLSAITNVDLTDYRLDPSNPSCGQGGAGDSQRSTARTFSFSGFRGCYPGSSVLPSACGIRCPRLTQTRNSSGLVC